MPRGSPLGLLSFLLLIDDLTVDCLTHKYVDDTILTELLLAVHSKLTCPLCFSSCHTKQNEHKLYKDQGMTPSQGQGPQHAPCCY